MELYSRQTKLSLFKLRSKMPKLTNPEKMLWASLFLKFILALYIPVFGDESYYWFWGQHLQLSYFDHPGMVGWLTWLGSKLTLFPMAVMVRWPFVILGTLSFFLFIKILQQLKQESQTITWLCLFYLMNPMLGIGSILATPDVPLVFFWSLSFWLTLQIIATQKTSYYALLGLVLGLGLCSKYHIVLFPISILLSLALSKQISIIQPKKLLLTVLFGLLFSLPVIIWNYNNDWASFAFQLNHGFNGKRFTIFWSITYVLGQIFIFNPFLLFQVYKSVRFSFVRKSAFVQWGFFLVSSLRAAVEANWPVTAHIQGLAAIQIDHKLKKWSLGYIVMIWLLLIGFLFTDYGKSKFDKIPNSIAAEKIWNKISSYSPIYGPTYQMSSLLHLISGQEILKLNELSRIDFYDSGIFPRPTEKSFYVLKYDTSAWPEWLENKNPRIQKIESISEYSMALYRIAYE
jgi:hypothetical protein